MFLLLFFLLVTLPDSSFPENLTDVIVILFISVVSATYSMGGFDGATATDAQFFCSSASSFRSSILIESFEGCWPLRLDSSNYFYEELLLLAKIF
jgi:hypothetical protein